jgi:alkylation response protein AidB-like acyl-CoA dehydrogenase
VSARLNRNSRCHSSGRVIGGFQALQHRLADLHVLVESAQSPSRAAAGDTPALGLRAAAVKVYCSEALMQTAGEMIQLHGAIGIIWEHRAHRYLKRAHGAMNLFGTPGPARRDHRRQPHRPLTGESFTGDRSIDYP